MIVEHRKPNVLMRLCRFLLRLLGWKLIMHIPDTKKFVVVGAWHTSNYDFIIAVLAAGAMGLPLKFIGKQALLDGKLGWLMKRLGVIGVDRSKRNNFVKQIAKKFEESEELIVVVPAEGTRGKVEYWKTGFYYMALEANVPIAFGVIDSAKHEIGIYGWFTPSGDREKDLEIVKDYFKDKRGVKPQNQAEIKFKPEPAKRIEESESEKEKMPKIEITDSTKEKEAEKVL